MQSQGDILKVYVNENPIYEVNQQNALQMIFQYAWMLFGECMNG